MTEIEKIAHDPSQTSNGRRHIKLEENNLGGLDLIPLRGAPITLDWFELNLVRAEFSDAALKNVQLGSLRT